jgi:hypothetical protein
MHHIVYRVLAASLAATSSLGAPLLAAPHHAAPAQNAAPLVARATPLAPPLPPQAPSLVAPVQPNGLFAAVTLADIGFVNGFRFANLGGRREVFVPVPQNADVRPRALMLVIDDMSAFEARRNLQVLVNDRAVTAIALDGKGDHRSVRVPLSNAAAKDGFIKLSFVYSGAVTPDRCIDVRYVGDSLTIRPETGIEIGIGAEQPLDVATTAALMPTDMAVVLPARSLTPSDFATALAIGRSLISSGRRVTYYRGQEALPQLARRDEAGRWMRGIVMVGGFDDTTGLIDAAFARVAGEPQVFGRIGAIRIEGVPALLVSSQNAVQVGEVLGGPAIAATRGVADASVGVAVPAALPTDRVTFDQLGIAPVQAEMYGRAELPVTIDMRRLPAGTRLARLMLDVMVAADADGEKAVLSVYVNERLLGSTVATAGETTHLDLALPPGLVGTSANIRAVVQRRSAQGDCRFEPLGYPTQILGSSALVLTPADGGLHDFSDLAPRWASGIEVFVPAAAAEHPTELLGLMAQVLNRLSADTAPIDVRFVVPGREVSPSRPFLAISDRPPVGATLRARFDRGRVTVVDKSSRTLLDLGGYASGAVAELVTAGDQPGLWIRSLAPSGALPTPRDLNIDHGDVAFLDHTGVALAMSTERDTLVRIAYPDQVSWLTVAGRFRSWIIGGLWLFVTAGFLLVLQRMFRRRPAGVDE